MTGEANIFDLEILFNIDKLIEVDAAWDDYYGPIYLREREGLDDITEADKALARKAREFFFEPNGVIDVDKLDIYQKQYTDAMFRQASYKIYSIKT